MNTQTQNRTSELAADALNTLIKALESGDSDALTNYLRACLKRVMWVQSD
jgi:hypothetical protein